MANKEVSIIVNTIDRSSKQFRHIGLAAESLKRELISVQGLAATALGGISVGVAAKGLFDLNASVEQLETSLRTVTGSAPAAQRSLAWIQDFAADTPYKVKELAQEFIDLTNYGLNAAQELPILGDMASALGKDLNQATEAFADAIQFEFERLKEFGIRANQTKNEVTFTWMENGQEMKRTVQKTATDVTNTLNDILNKYKGGMEAQSKTALGMLSTLSDGAEQFALKATGEVFERLEGKIKETLDWMDQAAKDGTLDKWADKVAENINDMADAVETLCDEDHLPLIIGLGKTVFTVWAIGKLTAISRGLFEISSAALKFGTVLKTNTVVSLIATAAKTGELRVALQLLSGELAIAGGAVATFGGAITVLAGGALAVGIWQMNNLVAAAQAARAEMARTANFKPNNPNSPVYAAMDYAKMNPKDIVNSLGAEGISNTRVNLERKLKELQNPGLFKNAMSANRERKVVEQALQNLSIAGLMIEENRRGPRGQYSPPVLPKPKVPGSTGQPGSSGGGKSDTNKHAENLAKVNEEINDQIKQMTLDTYEYSVRKIFEEAANYEKAGASKVKVAQYVNLKLKDLLKDEKIDPLQAETDRAAKIQEAVAQETEKRKAIFDQRKDLTDQLMQLTLSEKDYAIWALEEQNKEAQVLYHQNLDTWKKVYEAKMAEIKAKYPEEPKTWEEAWDKGLKEHLESMESWSQGISDIAKTTAQSMEKSMSDFFFDAVTGKLHGLGSYVSSFLQSVARALSDFYAQRVTQQIVGSWFGGSKTTQSKTASPQVTSYAGFGDMGIPQMATGGPVIAGKSYIVGDGGEPEIFTPGANGYITPFSRLKGSGGVPLIAASQSAAPQIEIHIHNETGQEMKVTRQETQMDGARTVMNLWLEGYARNIGSVQSIVNKGVGY